MVETVAPSSSGPRPASSLVVVGASAGGVEALRSFVGRLPADLDAAVLVVLHVPATGTSALPMILDRAGPLPVRHAVDGDELVAGQVLVARPDHHLVVRGATVSLSRGPQENGHRPAVDVLFRSAARAWDGRVVAVVLSGTLDDGAAGVLAVERNRGHCLAQDPDEALYAGMPRAAARVVSCEVLGVHDLAARATALSRAHADEPGPPTSASPADMETLMADLDPGAMHDDDRPGDPSGYGCPDCAGSLFAIDDGPMRRFRCRVGHAWTADTLMARQSAEMESALWMALRSLEEKASLNRDLAERARERGSERTAVRFEEAARAAVGAAEQVRILVADLGARLDPEPPSELTDELDRAEEPGEASS